MIQFICGMNLTSDEFPGVAASLVTDQLGLINQFENPGCVPLFVKTFLSLPFFLTLRLFVREKIAGVDRHMPSISENGISGRQYMIVCYR